MKNLAVILGMAFGSVVTAMEHQNTPYFDFDLHLEEKELSWLEACEPFDIRPVFNEHISNLTAVGADFVNNVVELNLEKCEATAIEQHFQSQSTEEARKCMELLSVVAGWPAFCKEEDLTERIVSLYDREKVTRKGTKYKEFVGDVLYMGFYKTFRKIDGSPVDKFDEHLSEFFRYVSENIYDGISGKSFDDRLGLRDCFVCLLYSSAPEYTLSEVWPNWYK
jgi:hypothetical protein